MFFTQKYLVADIGGTHTRIAIIDDQNTIHNERIIDTQTITDFSTCIATLFLEWNLTNKIRKAALAVAGAIDANRENATISHNGFTINTAEIKQKLNLTKVVLLNDFEAIGFGIQSAKPETFTELTALGTIQSSTTLIMGAGTGLGATFFRKEDSQKTLAIPFPSAAGHARLPLQQQNALEKQLEAYFRSKKYVLESESFVSGEGIVRLYEFCLSKKIKHSAKYAQEIKKAAPSQKAALISKYAIEHQDPACEEAIDLFVKCFARSTQSPCLTILANHLVITGDIAWNNMSLFKEAFREYFVSHDNPHMRALLEQVKISILHDPTCAYRGAKEALKYTI